ncbi:hypothetical protein [Amycolatopsis sp.]|uniref:hypothetical protein n=1 Tax=Amycolatopsis sp. TaxID=37632 RepID=UPI002CF42893|nr:hypothetical protein [Amycolatopsis sp.]HVV11762.1 hypothetical protein [Amycolatopsis sp.]
MSTYIDMNGDPAEIMAKGAQWATTGMEYADSARQQVQELGQTLDEPKTFGKDEIGEAARKGLFNGEVPSAALDGMFKQDHTMGESFGEIGDRVVTAIGNFMGIDQDGKHTVDKIEP